jgi:RNA recognition motif-containing protein
MVNIYVGNLSHDATEDEIKKEFEAFGEVASVKIIKDMFSGFSKGFGFVEMPSKKQAQEAMSELNGKSLKDKPLRINEARPRGDNRRRGGNRGGGGGRGRRY